MASIFSAARYFRRLFQTNQTIMTSAALRRRVTNGHRLQSAIAESLESRILMTGTPNHLVFTVQPTTTVAGNAISSVTVSVEDSGNSVVTSDNSAITFLVNSGPGSTAGTVFFAVSATNGVATFSGLSLTQAGSYTLKATDPGLTTGISNSFAITPDAASQLAFTTQPAGTTAGSTLAGVTVSVEDQFGNVVTSDTSNVTLALASGNGSVGGTTTVAASSGVATFSSLVLNTAGTDTLIASDGSLATATSQALTITPASADHLAFTTQPADGTAGALAATTVAVEDQFNNIVTSDSSNVTLTLASGSGSVGGTLTVAAVNGVATFSGLTLTTAGAKTLSAADTGITGVTSNSFTLAPAAATHLVFSQAPSNVSAGTLGTITVSVLDQYGNVVTSNSSNVTVALTSGTGTLLGTLTVAASSGVATFSDLALHTSGNFTLTATDGSLTNTGADFTVSPAAATHLAVTTQPANMSAGAVGGVTVAVEDQYGNIVTSDTSNITLAMASGGGTLGGTLTVAAVNGVATFNALSIHTPGTFTLGASDGALTGATSSSFIVTPAASTHLVFTQQPGNVSAGALGTVIVSVEDQFNNVVTADGTTVTLTLASGTGTLLGTRSVSAVNGVATFTNLAIHTAGSFTLSASDGSLSSATSGSFIIAPAAASQLVFNSEPSDTTAGNSLLNASVAVEDQYGNIVTSSSANISLAVTSAGSTFNLVVAAVNGVATFGGISLVHAGPSSIRATSSGLAPATSNPFTIVPAAPSQLVITQQTSSTTAGLTLNAIKVTVEDQYGNTVTSNTSNVTLTVGSGSGTLGGTVTVAAVNGVATFSNLSITQADGYTLHAADGGLAGATSNSFTISPAAASQVVFTQQTSGAVAGVTLSAVTVSVEDQFGNVVTTDSSNVTVALGSGSATLGGTLTVAASSGVATFSTLLLTKTGTFTFVATDGLLSGATSSNLTITPDAATHLAFTTQPSDVNAGLLGTVTVEVEDQFNNVVTTDSSNVTLAIGTGSGSLLGTLTVVASSGVASFSDLAIHTPDTYTLSATDTGLTGDTSSSFAVAPAAATHLVFTVQPASATAGNLANVTVSVKDQYGNVVTGDTSNITLSIASGNGSLGGTLTAAAVNGVATFSGLSLHTAGAHTLQVSDGELTGATSNSFTISPATAAQVVFTAQPENTTAGALDTITVAVQDVFGNLVTGNTSNVTLSVASGPGSLGGTLTVAAINGVATFSNLSLHTAGDYTIHVADGALSAATTSSFTIAPTTASQIVVTQQPGNLTAGSTLSSVNVTVEDQYGNTVTSDNSNVSLSVASGPGSITGTLTAPAVNGVATFSDLSLTTAGNYVLGAADGALSGDATTTFTVSPAAASQLVISTQPTTTIAGATVSSVVVNVEDQYNNIVTTNSSNVTIALASGTGTLNGTLTVAAASGVATFADLSINTTGDYTLGLSDGLLDGATSGTLTITPDVATHLAIIAQPSGNVTAGALGNVTIAVEDQFNNVVTTDSSNITIAIGSGNGSLGGTLTLAATNGLATFSDLSIHQVSTDALTVTDTGLTSATSGTFTIIPAVATQLVITGQPGNSIAGTLGAITVKVEDQYGNVVTTGSPTITAAIASGTGTLTGTATANATNGIATFSSLAITKSGDFTLGLSMEGVTGATTSSFTVSPAAASQLVVTTQPTTTTAGATVSSVIVQVEDQYNNIVTSDSSNVIIALNGSGATLNGSLTVAATSGVATFSDLSLTQTGNYTLAVNDGGLTGALSSSFTITPDVATHLAITTQPGSTNAGNLGSVIVAVEDQFNNIVTTDSSNVTISIASGTGPLLGTQTVAAVNGVATFSTLGLHIAGTYTLAAADTGLTGATSSSFVISPTAATKLIFTTQPIGGTAGATLASVAISVEDQYGNVVTSNSSTISLLVNTGGTSFTLNTAATSGVATFGGFSITRSGDFTLLATDSGLTAATSSDFVITPDVATHITFTTQPANMAAGTLATIAVSIEDQYNNIVTTDSSNVVIALGSGNGSLGGTLTVAASNGTASFSTLSLHTPDSYTLTATDGSFGPITSTSFAVTPAAPSQLVITQQPADMVAGALGTVTVQVEDQYGNVVTSNASNVTLAIASGNATLGGTITVAASNGVATFNNVTLTKSGNYTLAVTDGSLSNATTSSFAVSPAAATKLAIITQPSGTIAGPLGSVSVAVEDQYNNVVTSDTSNISVASNTTVGGTLTVAAVNGVATFSDLSIHTAGTFALTATDGGLSNATSNSFAITPAAADHLAITTAPSNMSAGLVGALTVAVEDQYNNIVTANSSNVTIALVGSGTLGGTLTVAATSGVATFSGLSIHTPGTFTVLVTDGGLSNATSGSFVVSPAAASQIVITTAPTTTSAGTLGTIVAAVEDQYGNVVTTNTSNVTIAIGSGNGTLTGTQTVGASSGIAIFADLSITKTGTYTLTLTDGGLSSATSSSFNITPAAANHLAFITQPAGTTAGSLANVTVAVEDQYNNIVTTDGSTITLTTGNGTLLGTTSAAAVNGVATFSNLSIHNVAAFTLTATDGELSNGTSSSFNITPAAASQLVITQSPVSTTAGTLGTLTVAVEDQYGNLETSDSSTVTVALGSGNATLGGSLTALASNGVATFSSLALTKAGAYTLTVTDGSLASATTGTITISPAAASQLVITSQPVNGTVGHLSTVTVAIEDQYNNILTNNTSNVSIAIGSGNGTLTGTSTVTAVNGIATFSNLTLTKAGAVALGVTDGILSSATSSSFTLAPDVFNHYAFTTQPAGTTAGSTMAAVTVALEDQYNNIETASNANVTILLGSGNATLGGTLTVAAVNGVATFSTLSLTKTGNYTLSTPDETTSTGFTIAPAAATHLVLTTSPVTTTAGANLPLVVAVEDQYGNVVTGNSSNVTIALASGNGTLGGTLTVAASNGIATFSTLSLTKTGSYTLGIADGILTGLVTGSFTINPAAASHLVFTQQPANSATGALGTVIATVEDQYNNIVTNNSSNVTVSLGGNTSLGGTTTVAALNGVATFTNLSVGLSGAYTLTASDGLLTSATSGIFNVAAKLAFTLQPSVHAAGTLSTVTVAVQDSAGQLLSSDNSPITLTIVSGPTGATLGGTVTVNAINGVATFSNLQLHTAGAYTLTATDGVFTAATSTPITITPAAASQLVLISQPSNGPAGTLAPFSAVVEDQFGNVVTSDASTVTATLASGSGSLGGTTTATPSNGVVTFSNLTIIKTGTFSLTLSDGALTSATTASFAVTPAAASHLVFITQPDNSAAGTMGTVSVAVQDAFGNLVTADNSTVTVALASGSGSLGGTTTVATSGGIATFSGLSLTKSGAYSLTATDGALTAATSDSFTVAAKLAILGQPTASVAGTIGTITVAIRDAFNNLLTTDNSPVTLSIAKGPAGGAISGTVTVNAVNGIATFTNVTLGLAGTYTLVATDGSITAALTKAIVVTPAAPASLVFLRDASNTTAGAKNTLSIQVTDQFGNLATNYKGAAMLTVKSGPAAISVKANVSKGIATFTNVVLPKAGTYTLQATAGSVTAASATFTVSPAVPKTLVFTHVPSTVAAGAPFTVIAKITDGFGNLVNSSANVVLSLASGKATLGGTLTVAAINGFATFTNVSVSKSGVYSLKATVGSASAKSTLFSVTAASGTIRH